MINYQLVIIVLTTIFSLSSCKCVEKQGGVTEIVDPIDSMPYTIDQNDDKVTLPDSLGGGKYFGFAMIELLIDDNSKIIKMNVAKIKLSNSESKKIFIDFQESEKSIPKEIVGYINFIKEYATNNLKIKKNGTPKKENMMMIMVRLSSS